MTEAAISAAVRSDPFPHAVAAQALPPPLLESALVWFETVAPWRLRVESFYEQHEFNLQHVDLPAAVRPLLGEPLIERFRRDLLSPLGVDCAELLEVNAHRLTAGQVIRIHNDYIGGVETHRVLIQLNRGWRDENGGLLMFFSSADAADVARVLRPAHGSAVAFEISPVSYHAVSAIRDGGRYTLVYTFRREG